MRITKNGDAIMRHGLMLVASVLVLAGCQSSPLKLPEDVKTSIASELIVAREQKPVDKPVPTAVSQALLPPLTVELPPVARANEQRFDLSVANARADQVFMSIASGTPYSIIVHPDVKELVSIRLKDVTLREALDSLREVYGYEYKLDGSRIYIMPIALQTRIFQVNYLAARRQGRAEVSVRSGSISAPVSGTGATTPNQNGTVPVGGSNASVSLEGTRVTTSSDNDFWADVTSTLKSIVGDKEGRSVVVNSNGGVIVVRAFPKELRAAEEYLNAMSLTVERQVMLEAKILEVQLDEKSTTGINWAAFTSGPNSRFGGGLQQPGTVLRTNGSVLNNQITIEPSPDVRRITTSAQNLASSIFGLAFQTSNFATLLTFLESQGTVHVLSSPRIATLNNQKALIKVGTDEFFVTNISTNVTNNGTSSTVSPTITTQPFFSGIALDVTPQISSDDLITLHIHPAVSAVSDKVKIIDLGALGVYQLPLASSNINESDTIVRVQDGSIAAIGGLMRQSQSNTHSGVPGSSKLGVVGDVALGSRDQELSKRELVILIKTTVIKGDSQWAAQAQEINDRVQALRR